MHKKLQIYILTKLPAHINRKVRGRRKRWKRKNTKLKNLFSYKFQDPKTEEKAFTKPMVKTLKNKQ